MALRTRIQGTTLVEVLISASLMLILLFAFYAVAEAIGHTRVVTESRLGARQNLRNALRRTQLFFGQATHLYSRLTPGTVTLGGIDCTLPRRDASDPKVFHPGDSLVFAVPVDTSHLEDIDLDPLAVATIEGPREDGQDGFCDNRFDVVCLTVRPHQPPDPRNPGGRQLVLMRWNSIKPPLTLAPATIDLAGLEAPDNIKIFDAYLKPDGPDASDSGWLVNLVLENEVPAAAVIHAEFSHQPANGQLQTEAYGYTFNSRNIF